MSLDPSPQCAPPVHSHAIAHAALLCSLCSVLWSALRRPPPLRAPDRRPVRVCALAPRLFRVRRSRSRALALTPHSAHPWCCAAPAAASPASSPLSSPRVSSPLSLASPLTMADTVQRVLEEMVPELEDLQRKGLLSSAEITSLVSHRTDFEYKLRRQAVAKIDFLRAIQYELNLVALKEKRRARLALDQHKKKSLSDFASMRRIAFLYERALRKLPHDLLLWKQYLEYSRRIGSFQVINKILPRAIQLNPKATDLWLLHAQWESSQGNLDGARTVLQRALRLNPQARVLWRAFFDLEIRFIVKMMERRRRMGIISNPDARELERANAGGDIDLRVQVQPVPAGTVEPSSADEELSRKQMFALQSCLLPRAILRNALASSKALREDMEFRLDFLRGIPSAMSAALSALDPSNNAQQTGALDHVDPSADADGEGAVSSSKPISLANFAYNHNPADHLLDCFLKFNGKSAANMAAEVIAAGGAEGLATDPLASAMPVAGPADDSEDAFADLSASRPSLSTRPYAVDFLPLCRELFEGLLRDFAHAPEAVRLNAEFEFIVARLGMGAGAKEEKKGEAMEDAADAAAASTAASKSPAQIGFALFESALSSSSLQSMRDAAQRYYTQHKQEVDATPGMRDRLLHQTEATLWAEYVGFAYAVLRTNPEDREVQHHLESLYARIGSGVAAAAASGAKSKSKKVVGASAAVVPSSNVLTPRVVLSHANFLLEMGQVRRAIEVMERALMSPTPASAAAASSSAAAAAGSVDFSRSLSLWLRFLGVHETIFAFQPTASSASSSASSSSSAAQQEHEEPSASNGKKRKKTAAAADSASPAQPASTSFEHVTEPFLDSLYDRALKCVASESQLELWERWISFKQGRMMVAAAALGAASPAAVTAARSSLIRAYLAVHSSFLRVLGSIPQPRGGVESLKRRYVQWMQTIVRSEVYASMQGAGAGARGGAAASKAQQQPIGQLSKKARRMQRAAAAAAGDDSDSDSDDAGAAAYTGAWPSAVPSLRLSPPAALRALVDQVLATPPVSLETMAVCIAAEGSFYPQTGEAASSAVPASGAASAAVATELAVHHRRMHALYERALLSFGATSPDLWFAYLSWVRALPQRVGGQQQQQLASANQIHARASREIKPEHQAHWAELQSMLTH